MVPVMVRTDGEIQHEDMVTVFEFDERTRNKDGGVTLPSEVRKYFG